VVRIKEFTYVVNPLEIRIREIPESIRATYPAGVVVVVEVVATVVFNVSLPLVVVLRSVALGETVVMIELLLFEFDGGESGVVKLDESVVVMPPLLIVGGSVVVVMPPPLVVGGSVVVGELVVVLLLPKI